MDQLTQVQRDVLIFIEESISKRKIAPTHREIMERFGWSSPGTAAKHLKHLTEKGYIALGKKRTRGIKVLRSINDPTGAHVFVYGPGGSLLTDEPVSGLALEPLGEKLHGFYGCRYLVAESMSRQTAAFIAAKLGGRLKEKLPEVEIIEPDVPIEDAIAEVSH